MSIISRTIVRKEPITPIGGWSMPVANQLRINSSDQIIVSSRWSNRSTSGSARIADVLEYNTSTHVLDTVDTLNSLTWPSPWTQQGSVVYDFRIAPDDTIWAALKGGNPYTYLVHYQADGTFIEGISPNPGYYWGDSDQGIFSFDLNANNLYTVEMRRRDLCYAYRLPDTATDSSMYDWRIDATTDYNSDSYGSSSWKVCATDNYTYLYWKGAPPITYPIPYFDKINQSDGSLHTRFTIQDLAGGSASDYVSLTRQMVTKNNFIYIAVYKYTSGGSFLGQFIHKYDENMNIVKVIDIPYPDYGLVSFDIDSNHDIWFLYSDSSSDCRIARIKA